MEGSRFTRKSALVYLVIIRSPGNPRGRVSNPYCMVLGVRSLILRSLLFASLSVIWREFLFQVLSTRDVSLELGALLSFWVTTSIPMYVAFVDFAQSKWDVDICGTRISSAIQWTWWYPLASWKITRRRLIDVKTRFVSWVFNSQLVYGFQLGGKVELHQLNSNETSYKSVCRI